MSEIISHMDVEHGVKGKPSEGYIECSPDLRGVTCALLWLGGTWWGTKGARISP